MIAFDYHDGTTVINLQLMTSKVFFYITHIYREISLLFLATLAEDFPRLESALRLLTEMQDNPEFSFEEPSSYMTAFLKRIESADPNDDFIDDDEKGVSWGHYQFTAGDMQCSTVITSWKAVGNTKIACRLIAAAVRTSMVAKYICKKQQLPTTSLLSYHYVEKVIEALCTVWDKVRQWLMVYSSSNSEIHSRLITRLTQPHPLRKLKEAPISGVLLKALVSN